MPSIRFWLLSHSLALSYSVWMTEHKVCGGERREKWLCITSHTVQQILYQNGLCEEGQTKNSLAACPHLLPHAWKAKHHGLSMLSWSTLRDSVKNIKLQWLLKKCIVKFPVNCSIKSIIPGHHFPWEFPKSYSVCYFLHLILWFAVLTYS